MPTLAEANSASGHCGYGSDKSTLAEAESASDYEYGSDLSPAETSGPDDSPMDEGAAGTSQLEKARDWTSRGVLTASEICGEPTEPPEILEPENCYDQTKCWGEMTGVPLPTTAVDAARQEETDRHKQTDAHDAVGTNENKAATGEEPISRRWTDPNRADTNTAEMRDEVGDENLVPRKHGDENLVP